MKFDQTFVKGFPPPFLLIIPLIVIIQLIWPEFFTRTLLNTSLEPHGYCLLWDPGLIYLHLGSDFLIGSSYVIISTTLVFIVFSTRKMDDYITKPIRRGVLSKMLERWIKSPISTDNTITSHQAISTEVTTSSPKGTLSVQEETLDQSLLDDLAKLQISHGTGKPLLQNVINLYNQDGQIRLENLNETSLIGDTKKLESIVHTLKGSCLNIGAKRMAYQCAELEAGCRDGQFTADQIQYLVAEIKDEYERVDFLLKRFFSFD